MSDFGQINNKSDFEKLVIAKQYVEVLKSDISKLKAENVALISERNQAYDQIADFMKMSADEKSQMRKEAGYKKILEMKSDVESKLNKKKRDYDKLLGENAKLKMSSHEVEIH